MGDSLVVVVAEEALGSDRDWDPAGIGLEGNLVVAVGEGILVVVAVEGACLVEGSLVVAVAGACLVEGNLVVVEEVEETCPEGDNRQERLGNLVALVVRCRALVSSWGSVVVAEEAFPFLVEAFVEAFAVPWVVV